MDAKQPSNIVPMQKIVTEPAPLIKGPVPVPSLLEQFKAGRESLKKGLDELDLVIEKLVKDPDFEPALEIAAKYFKKVGLR